MHPHSYRMLYTDKDDVEMQNPEPNWFHYYNLFFLAQLKYTQLLYS